MKTMVLSAYVRKEERFNINDPGSHLKKLKKDKQSQPKVERSE